MNDAEAKILESSSSIRVRVGAALLTISGDAREMLDVQAVANEIRGLDHEDAICALLGLGFVQLGTTRKWRDEGRPQAGARR